METTLDENMWANLHLDVLRQEYLWQNSRHIWGTQASSGGGSLGWDLEMAQLRTFRWTVPDSKGLWNKMSSWRKLTHFSICWMSYAGVDIPQSTCVIISWDWLIYVLFETQFFFRAALTANDVTGERLASLDHVQMANSNLGNIFYWFL